MSQFAKGLARNTLWIAIGYACYRATSPSEKELETRFQTERDENGPRLSQIQQNNRQIFEQLRSAGNKA